MHRIDPAGYQQWTEDGITFAEHPGLDVRVIVVPPDRMPDGAREHHHRRGVYINAHPGLADHRGRIPFYAGEGKIIQRFRAHAREEHTRDLRTGYIIHTHRSLLREERQYMESTMFEAPIRGPVDVAARNNVPPVRPKLPRALKVAMDFRAAAAWDLLCRLQAPFAALEPARLAPGSPVFRIHTGLQLNAQGYYRGGRFWLCRGAEVRKRPTNCLKQGVRDLTARLRAEGRLVDVGPHLVTTADIAFRRSSTASCLVLQTEASGRRAWRVEGTGETLGEWRMRAA